MKKLLLTMLAVIAAQSCFGGQLYHHIEGKVNEVFYIGPSKGAGFLKIAKLLKREEGVIWLVDPDQGQSYRHAYWIGYKDGIAVFHARYFFGKRDVKGEKWGESLHVLPIESPLDTPPISKIDADWARANAARIEAEKKAKAAAGPTKQELESAAHDAEIRASNERALKSLPPKTDPPKTDEGFSKTDSHG